jgi:sulfite oxidase
VKSTYDEQGLNTGSYPTITADALITPTDRFFRRSHAEPPIIDARAWRLEVGGLVDRPARYSLVDLTAQFAPREVAATLVCAGMRRAELLTLGELPGELPWEADAASTGRWSGVRLSEVLRAAGVQPAAAHVEFIGLDRVERHGQTFGFGGSIDLEKALDDDVILATRLNAEPLPRAHGYPMRVVVPGWIGARQVKWLGRINVLAEPSGNYFQTKAYRIQREQHPDDPRDVSAGVAMTGVPINAVIIDPEPGATVPAGVVRVRGWALGSEGRPLRAIEVSADGGHAWTAAQSIASEGKWTWTFWQAELQLGAGAHVICVRAADETDVMPSSVHETWNVKGYGNNAWHRVPITVR